MPLQLNDSLLVFLTLLLLLGPLLSQTIKRILGLRLNPWLFTRLLLLLTTRGPLQR